MNKFILSGKLGQQPILRYTKNEKFPVTTLRLATKEMNNKTVWHNVTVWNKEAEICCRFLDKGSSVLIEGYISYNTTLVDEKQITTAELISTHVEFM